MMNTKNLFGISLVVLLGLSSSFAFGKKKQNAVPHWNIQGGVHVYSEIFVDPKMPSAVSDKEKKRVEAIAKRQGYAATIFVEGTYSPVPAPNLVPINIERDCKSSKTKSYCQKIDALINEARGVYDCPAIQYDTISVMAHPGMMQIGIDRNCVQTLMKKTVAQAKVDLEGDKNLDLISGALALEGNCKPPLFARDPNRCDGFDVAIRETFVTDLLSDMKNSPDPLREVVTSKILFNGQLLELTRLTEPAAKSSELLWGEFEVEKVNPDSYPGRILVQYRDKNLIYATPYTGTIQQFAKDIAQSKCGQQSGTFDGEPYIGTLEDRSSIQVFYLARCLASSQH